MSYTTYVTTWGTDPLVQIQDMINKSVLQSGTRVVMAFASLIFLVQIIFLVLEIFLYQKHNK